MNEVETSLSTRSGKVLRMVQGCNITIWVLLRCSGCAQIKMQFGELSYVTIIQKRGPTLHYKNVLQVHAQKLVIAWQQRHTKASLFPFRAAETSRLGPPSFSHFMPTQIAVEYETVPRFSKSPTQITPELLQTFMVAARYSVPHNKSTWYSSIALLHYSECIHFLRRSQLQNTSLQGLNILLDKHKLMPENIWWLEL